MKTKVVLQFRLGPSASAQISAKHGYIVMFRESCRDIPTHARFRAMVREKGIRGKQNPQAPRRIFSHRESLLSGKTWRP